MTRAHLRHLGDRVTAAIALAGVAFVFLMVLRSLHVGMTGGALILGGCGGTYLGARGLVWVFGRCL